MAAVARDRTRRWEPFGVTEADFAAVPDRDGVQVMSTSRSARRPGTGPGRMVAAGAAVALGVLAVAAAAVSWDAQYAMVRAAKPVPVVAALEAGIPDVGAVIFAALGVALALHGKRALRSRALNAACIGISLGMNALAAGRGWRDPGDLGDARGGLRRRVGHAHRGGPRLGAGPGQHQGEVLADDGLTPLAAVASLALWLLRLSLAPRSTLTGFRSWVITDCPVAPGLRPGHLAEVKRPGRTPTSGSLWPHASMTRPSRKPRQQRGRPTTRRRGHAPRRLGSGPSSTGPAPTRASSSRRPSPTRPGTRRPARMGRTAGRAAAARAPAGARGRCPPRRARAGFRAARIAALEDATARLQAERDQLASDLRAARRPSGQAPGHGAEARPPGSRGGRATKRDQMIELAGQRRDLASVPLAEGPSWPARWPPRSVTAPGRPVASWSGMSADCRAPPAENQSTSDKEGEAGAMTDRRIEEPRKAGPDAALVVVGRDRRPGRGAVAGAGGVGRPWPPSPPRSSSSCSSCGRSGRGDSYRDTEYASCGCGPGYGCTPAPATRRYSSCGCGRRRRARGPALAVGPVPFPSAAASACCTRADLGARSPRPLRARPAGPGRGARPVYSAAKSR